MIAALQIPSPKAAVRSAILLIEDDPFQAHARESVLERHFPLVERASDAAEAFIKLDDSAFRKSLTLIIVGLHLPGVAGPSFVTELVSRVPHIPVLVIGRSGEIPHDYAGDYVHFLPSHASSQDVLAAARSIVSEYITQVA